MRVPHAEAGSEARIVETAARGRLVVWDTPGPLGAPTLVLLHGVTLDAATNWSGAVPDAGAALPRAGHGPAGPRRGTARPGALPVGGLRNIAAVVRALGTGPVIMAGYSMGGMIAQVFWCRHPELTAGLVLCATARNVSGSFLEQLTSMTMPFVVGALARSAGVPAERGPGRLAPARRHPGPARAPGRAGQDAAHPAGHRARGHAGGLRLQLAPLDRRRRRALRSAGHPARPGRAAEPPDDLARALPGAEVVEVDGNHDVFLDAPGAFAHALTAACLAAATPQSRPDGSEQAS